MAGDAEYFDALHEKEPAVVNTGLFMSKHSGFCLFVLYF